MQFPFLDATIRTSPKSYSSIDCASAVFPVCIDQRACDFGFHAAALLRVRAESTATLGGSPQRRQAVASLEWGLSNTGRASPVPLGKHAKIARDRALNFIARESGL